jgi:hypothetical protein
MQRFQEPGIRRKLCRHPLHLMLGQPTSGIPEIQNEHRLNDEGHPEKLPIGDLTVEHCQSSAIGSRIGRSLWLAVSVELCVQGSYAGLDKFIRDNERHHRNEAEF